MISCQADRLWAGGTAGQPGDFLRQTVGARALSLGGAFTGLADDASAVYWNPAGLALLDKPEITATHIILFENTSYDFIAAGLPPRPWGAVSLGYVRQSSGGFEQRAGPLDSPTNFSIVDSALIGGWGYTIPSKYSFGTTARIGAALKNVGESIGSVAASGWGGDLGLDLAPFPHSQLGVYFQNAIQPRLTFVSQPISYARAVHVSGSYDYHFNETMNLVPVVEITKVDQDNADASGGLEVWYKKFGALRFGMNADGFASGVGLRLGNVQFDYGVLLHDLGLTHQMTFSLRFGQTKEELAEFIRRGIQRFTKDEASQLAKAYLQQGELYFKDQDYTGALKQMEAAALWDPQDHRIEQRLFEVRTQVDKILTQQILERTVFLAQQQMERGNYMASQAYWSSVLEADPGNERAREAMARIEQTLNLQQRAEFKRAQQQQKEQEVNRAISAASELLQKSQYRSAIAEVEHALKTAGENGPLKILLDKARAEREKWAQDRFQQGLASAQSRDNQKAIEILGTILTEYPDYQPALEKVAQLKQMTQAPVSPELRKQLDRQYYAAVDAYLHGRYKDAGDFIDQILVKDPLNENARKLREKVDAAMRIAQ